MSKYVIKREDVCAGQLLKPIEMSCKIYDENHNEVSEQELIERGIPVLSASCGLICRGMLFNVNEDGLANDLMYTTPTNYPIEGIKSKVHIASDFYIENYVELNELLKYLKYGVDLTQNDLNQIYRKLIIHRWWLNNHIELFGFKKISGGYCTGGAQTLPMSIYENLNSISCYKNGNPHKEEPGFSLIKKIR